MSDWTEMWVMQKVPKLSETVPRKAAVAVQLMFGRTAYTRLRGIRLARKLLKDFEAKAVANARAEGDSWEKIGDALGVSAQTVHKRYARNPSFYGPEPTLEDSQEIAWPEELTEPPEFR